MRAQPFPMGKGRLLGALLLGWLGWCSPVAAAEEGGKCTRALAEPATIAAINADYESWRGRCVSLSGIVFDNHLFADRLATLESGVGYREDLQGSLFLYGQERVSIPRRSARIRITGIVGSCKDAHAAVAAMQAEEPQSIIMVSGYCHTSLENFLQPVALRRLSLAPVPRLTEAEVPADRRPLVEASAGLPRYADHVAAAQALAAAMAAGDVRAYMALTDAEIGSYGDSNEKDAPAWLRRHVREAKARFGDQRALRRRFAALAPFATRQGKVFVERDLSQDAQQRVAILSGFADSGFITCWCEEENCDGRWPVAVFDADNAPERPYLCVRTGDYKLYKMGGGDIAIQAEAPMPANGFAEPTVESSN